MVQEKTRTAITLAMNNVDLTLLSPYGGDVVSFGVVMGRGCMAFCGARRQITPAVWFVNWKWVRPTRGVASLVLALRACLQSF